MGTQNPENRELGLRFKDPFAGLMEGGMLCGLAGVVRVRKYIGFAVRCTVSCVMLWSGGVTPTEQTRGEETKKKTRDGSMSPAWSSGSEQSLSSMSKKRARWSVASTYDNDDKR